jgi:hypothetical protein
LRHETRAALIDTAPREQQLVALQHRYRYDGRLPVGQYAHKNPHTDRKTCECRSSSPSDATVIERGASVPHEKSSLTVDSDSASVTAHRSPAGRIRSSAFPTTRW